MRGLSAFVAVALLLPLTAQSQGLQDGSDLSRAVARYVTATLLPKKIIGLDTVHVLRGSRTAPQGVTRAADAGSIARELGTSKMGKADDFLRCPGGSKECDFIGVDAVVTLDAPVVRGTSGFVRVLIQQKTGDSRRPLLVTDGVIRLVRSGASWTVVGYDNHSIS